MEPVSPFVSGPKHTTVTVQAGLGPKEAEKPPPPPPNSVLANFTPTLVEPVARPSVSVVHQKIPAECFSQTVSCDGPEGTRHMCCEYM